MVNTPSQRQTRSGSNSNSNISLNDIKTLIESCKLDILDSMKSQIAKVSDMFPPLINRISELEKENEKLSSRTADLESKQELFSTNRPSSSSHKFSHILI